MPIDLFQPPYYDDYLDSKDSTGAQFHSRGFNQILFKPGYAVQARELTQMQSILKDQITKFGSNIFKHGSMVVPGNSFSQMNLCRIRATTASYEILNLEGSEIYHQATGLRAYVKKVTSSNNTASIYLQYLNIGTDLSGADVKIFSTDHEIKTQNGGSFVIDLVSAASMAFINAGVFFINGSFVYVSAQSTVIDDSATPTKSVRLKIVESIVDSDTDSTLLDLAQGTNNYAAPGADRLVMKLELYSANPSDVITDDVIELMRFNSGVLEEHATMSKYNEIDRYMAKRTYDESGNYVVKGLVVSVREHLKSTYNGGIYPAPPPLAPEDVTKYGYADKLAVIVSPGQAYVGGYSVEKLARKIITIDKSRDFITTPVTTSLSYGQYFYVTNFNDGLPNITARSSVNLYNFYTGSPTVIGTANVIALDLVLSDTTTLNKSIFKLVVSDLVLNSEYYVTDIGKIIKSGGDAFDCKVLHKYILSPVSTGIEYTAGNAVKAGSDRQAVIHRSDLANNSLYVFKDTNIQIPLNSDIILEWTGTSPTYSTAVPLSTNNKIIDTISLVTNKSNNLLVPINTESVKSATDIVYKIYYKATQTASSSSIIFSVSSVMPFDPIEAGNLIIMNGSTDSLVSILNASLNGDGTQLTVGGVANDNSIHIIASCTKTNQPYKIKTASQFSRSITFDTTTQNSSISLVDYDVFEIVSITSSVDNKDYTSAFILDKGQRDYYYDISSLKYSPDYAKPPFGTLVVVYNYFAHSTGADYFVVDSYDTAYRFNSSIMTYTSKDSGIEYDLSNIIDFRPKKIDTAYTLNLDSRITTTVQKYIPRIDAVVCGPDSELSVISGMASVNPIAPNVDSANMHLANLYIPAYTINANAVKVEKINNRGYTMHDVAKIDKRIADLEDYVTLTQLENTSINYDIVDVKTGLSRFKSGYLIDSFTDMDSVSDILNSDFKVSYVSETIVPQFDTCVADLYPTATGLSNVHLVGGQNGFLMLPYVESDYAKQPLSSKVTNINPYALTAWTGDLRIVPAFDYWVENTYAPNRVLNFTRNTVRWSNGSLISIGPITPVAFNANVSPLELALTWSVSSAKLTSNYKTPTLIPQPSPITLEQARLLITYS